MLKQYAANTFALLIKELLQKIYPFMCKDMELEENVIILTKPFGHKYKITVERL